MSGGRGLSVAACLWLAAACAVIDATDEDAVDVACESILTNGFDDTARWEDYSEPGASVERARDAVHITAAPSEEDFSAYADLHSRAVLAVAGTELVAAVTVPEPAGTIAGISWTRDGAEDDEEQDYYDMIVDTGTLVAVRREVGGEDTWICRGECPPYDPLAHAFFRLRSAGGDVLYEVSAGDGAWTEIARAPRADQVYRAIAFVYAEAPDISDLSVTRMEWSDCAR